MLKNGQIQRELRQPLMEYSMEAEGSCAYAGSALKKEKIREWKAYYDSRFSDTEAFQGLLMDRNVDQFLKNVDEVWANAHISG